MRSSTPSSRLEALIEEALEWSSKHRLSLQEGLELIVTPSPGADPAARILYTGVSHSGVRCLYARPSEVSLTLLPYREYRFAVVGMTLDPKDSRIIQLAETSSILGAEAIYIVAPPLHPVYEDRLSSMGVERIVVPNSSPLIFMSVASLAWTPRLLGSREDRFRSEIRDLPASVAWVEETFSNIIASASDRMLNVYYTPFTMPGAEYLFTAGSSSHPIPLDLLGFSSIRPEGGETLIMLTSTEEPSYRDLVRTAMLRSKKPLIANINTDPITAGFYSIILAALISGKHL